MNGILTHQTMENIEDILESGYLKSKYQLIEDKPELFLTKETKDFYGTSGPIDVPLIFFTLMFENAIPQYNKILRNTFIFDPLLMEDYGNMKPKKSEFTSHNFFVRGNTKQEYPKSRVWFNTCWSYGTYQNYDDIIKEKKGCFSLGYDRYLPLELNIFAFNYAKEVYIKNEPRELIRVKNDKRKYEYYVNKNEIVIFEKEICLEDYLLGIYIDKVDKDYRKIKTKFSEKYNIIGTEIKTKKFIQDFFKN